VRPLILLIVVEKFAKESVLLWLPKVFLTFVLARKIRGEDIVAISNLLMHCPLVLLSHAGRHHSD
jgi:hypothetical protein